MLGRAVACRSRMATNTRTRPRERVFDRAPTPSAGATSHAALPHRAGMQSLMKDGHACCVNFSWALPSACATS